MNQNNLGAPSTIAMSAVDVLAFTGPLDLEGLWRALAEHDYEIDREPLREALEQAVLRRLVSKSGDAYASSLPKGWIVRDRDREDPEGWTGWVAQSPDGCKRRLSGLQMELA